MGISGPSIGRIYIYIYIYVISIQTDTECKDLLLGRLKTWFESLWDRLTGKILEKHSKNEQALQTWSYEAL